MPHSPKDLSERGKIHKLAFGTGDSTITGRMYVYEPCYDYGAVEKHLPPKIDLVVNGHTPQWSGLPMIATVERPSENSTGHVIVLDTQYTDRINNNHALMTNNDGAFFLKGSWIYKNEYFNYSATSSDPFIGTKLIPENDKTHFFRILCKIDERMDNKKNVVKEPEGGHGYIAVRYTFFTDLKKPEVPGTTEIVVVSVPRTAWTFATTHTALMVNEILEGDAGLKNEAFTLVPKMAPRDLMIRTSTTRLSAFCGDIEASIPFLTAFLEHALGIANQLFPSTVMVESMRTALFWMWNTPPNFHKYGINKQKLDTIVNTIYLYTYRLKALGINIGCIGDVVGDPLGTGNPSGTRFIDEFVCAHWAAYNITTLYGAGGNREVNKIRFIDEIPNFRNMTKHGLNPTVKKALTEYFNDPKNKFQPAMEALKPFVYPALYQ
jgi:hypothetical protein